MKKKTKIFPPYSIPFLSVLHRNKTLYSFCKRGKRSVVKYNIDLDYTLYIYIISKIILWKQSNKEERKKVYYSQLTIEAIYPLFGSSPAMFLHTLYLHLPCNQIIPLPKQEQCHHKIAVVTSLENYSSIPLTAFEKLQYSYYVQLLRACDTFGANSSSQALNKTVRCF